MEPRGEIETDVRPGEAVVRLRGEHDLYTRPALVDALNRVSDQPRVLVDLRACTYIDTTLITALLDASQKLADNAGELEVIVPSERNSVRRALDLMHVEAVLPVRIEPEAPRTQE